MWGQCLWVAKHFLDRGEAILLVVLFREEILIKCLYIRSWECKIHGQGLPTKAMNIGPP